MMGLKIVIFALLLISLQHAVGDSSQSILSDDVCKIETAELSHHHLHRRGLADLFWGLFKRQKNKDNSKTLFSSNMKWEAYEGNQEIIVCVVMKGKTYYITREKNCKPVFTDNPNSVNNLFLANVGNIETLEWKSVMKHKLMGLRFKVVPPFTIETCDGYIISRNNQGLGYMTAKSKTFVMTMNITDEAAKPDRLEVLTINFDNIKEEYLTNVQFNSTPAQRNKKPSMLKNLTVVNNNCNEMKQMVKINSNFQETASIQTGNTLLIGGSLGIKKDWFEAGVKVELTGTESESNTGIKETGYEYTQELDIPPRCSCNLVIDSNVVVTTVPFTAQLTRVYKDDAVNIALIDGTYSYQESSEMRTNFVSCTKLTGKKC